MRTQKPVLEFVRLSEASFQMGAKSDRRFVAALLALTHRERREVANLVRKDVP